MERNRPLSSWSSAIASDRSASRFASLLSASHLPSGHAVDRRSLTFPCWSFRRAFVNVRHGGAICFHWASSSNAAMKPSSFAMSCPNRVSCGSVIRRPVSLTACVSRPYPANISKNLGWPGCPAPQSFHHLPFCPARDGAVPSGPRARCLCPGDHL